MKIRTIILVHYDAYSMNTRKGYSFTRWIVTLGIIITIGLAAIWAFRQFAGVAVSVTTVETGPVIQAFYSTGTVQPDREYPIKSNTAGILTEVRADKGSAVRKGDVLAIVADPVLQFLVDKSKAELDEKLQRVDEKSSPVLMEFDAKISAATELLTIAKRESGRLEEAITMNAASQSDLDTALDRLKRVWIEGESLKSQKEAKKLELQREVEVAKSALSTAQWNLDQQTLRAPVNGAVLDRPTSIGTRVAVNESIMRVADVTPAKLVMRAAVDEEDVTKVREGQIVRMSLYAFEGDVLSGKVTRIYDQADSERRTFEVDVQLDQPKEGLQPGMTGELIFVLYHKDDCLVLPTQSLQKSKEKEWIYLAKDGKLKRIDAKIGLRSIERIEVLAGIEKGDLVILTPMNDPVDGERVRVTEQVDSKIAAGLNKPPPVNDSFKGF